MSHTLEGTKCDGCGKVENMPDYGKSSDEWTSTGWPTKGFFDGQEVDLCPDCDSPTGDEFEEVGKSEA